MGQQSTVILNPISGNLNQSGEAISVAAAALPAALATEFDATSGSDLAELDPPGGKPGREVLHASPPAVHDCVPFIHLSSTQIGLQPTNSGPRRPRAGLSLKNVDSLRPENPRHLRREGFFHSDSSQNSFLGPRFAANSTHLRSGHNM
jgi:hypothetical protein